MTGASTDEPDSTVLVVPGDAGAEAVEYAMRVARDLRADVGGRVEVLAAVDSNDVRERVEDAVSIPDSELDVTLRVRVEDVSAGDPVELADALLEAVGTRNVAHAVVDGDSNASVSHLRDRLGTNAVEVAPFEDPGRRPLRHPGGLRRLAALFGLAYLFYLALGGFAGGLDLLTGAVSAGVVALSLSHVAFRREPTLARTAPRLLRVLLFLPVLLWEVAKANVAIAFVILHPRLPIDPSTGSVETRTEEGLERMVLANSVTLTPGTLTVDVDGPVFTVHSLTAGARRDLADGRLPRLVRWVFHGDERTGGEER